MYHNTLVYQFTDESILKACRATYFTGEKVNIDNLSENSDVAIQKGHNFSEKGYKIIKI